MKKLLFVINVDWFFISHFLPAAVEAQHRGYEVHIACGLTDKKEYLESFGFTIHSLALSRDGTSFAQELKTLGDMYRVLKLVNAQTVEFLTIKPVLYGGIISKFFSINRKVFYITGLGYVFIKKGFKGFLVRSIVKFLYFIAISGKNSKIITENSFDKKLLSDLNVVDNSQINIIRGAGVDISHYKLVQESQKTTVVMASRLLKDKGVFEYIQAAKILKQRGIQANFELYGDVDIYNPTTLTAQDLEEIKKDGSVQLMGYTSNITKVFEKSNIVVLPSYREGLPKVLVEAAASGRVVVTTDVPGCRDAIEPNSTGLLCNVKDAESLAESIEKLILNPNLRGKMGKSGRALAEKEFAIEKIVEKHLEVLE